ncbi:MAG: hypothetical protein HC767_09835 [Akkermansiaceae bacterium]|nr:hypothetical protein [Akkermansiaceae bacterium]
MGEGKAMIIYSYSDQEDSHLGCHGLWASSLRGNVSLAVNDSGEPKTGKMPVCHDRLEAYPTMNFSRWITASVAADSDNFGAASPR